LDRLAAECVLVRSADAGETDAHEDGARLRLGERECAQLELAGLGHDGGAHLRHEATSSTRTQRCSAAARSIASHTACTRAPCSRSGSHGPSGQRWSRSAAWLAKLTPYPTPCPIGHHSEA